MVLNAEQQHINYQRIEHAIRYLEDNFQTQPDLDEIAEKVHLSPFHFQRIFTEWAGISPKRFLQFLTVDFLKAKLQESRSVMHAAEFAGLSAQSRVYDLFTTLEAVTLQEYRHRGSGIHIDYGFHRTLFGPALMGVTTRGICWLSFLAHDEDPNHAVEEMKAHWHNSVFHENNALAADMSERVFNQPSGRKKLHLLVKGTNFQIKVWEALLRIPMGDLATYKDVASRIGSPAAMQAVGSAVGSNHIAWLIPCHRVIRQDGILGDYRWSSARKKSMIGWEMARHAAPNNH